MSHITKIRVRNIQSHKDTTLNLCPGVNAIVGVTDSGKSALYRALVWGITNTKPRGDNFRSNWGGESAVKIDFDDDMWIERSVDKDNLYDMEGLKEPFTAFKDKIPEAICEAINMNEINLQTQRDMPFLLSESPGDVAKILNRVANLSNIDSTISNIRKKALAVSRDMASVSDQIEDLEKQEKSFAYLTQMEKDVEKYNELVERWQGTDDEVSLLSHLIEAIEHDQKDIVEIARIVSFESKVSEALSMSEESRKLKESIILLSEIIDDTEEWTETIEVSKRVLEHEEEVERVLDLCKQKEQVRNDWLILNQIYNSTRQLEHRAGTLEIEKLEKILKATFPNVCPLCGGKQ